MSLLSITRRWSSSALRPARSARRVLDSVQRAWLAARQFSSAQLRERCQRHRQSAATRERRFPVETTVELHALTAEAIRRTSGKELYAVQLLAGIMLARGCITEMQTGEGKTLTTLLPAVVFALQGRGVHVATTNAYLASRDFEELGPALELLGLTAGVLPEQHDDAFKRVAYQQDVTFGTGYDFGFDYLRDQIAARQVEKRGLGVQVLSQLRGLNTGSLPPLQRPLAYAIIDEADSVLIDEGTMPLILSGPTGEPADPQLLAQAASVAAELVEGVDVEIDRVRRGIRFTASGWQRLHAIARTEQRRLLRPWSVYVENALRAEHFLRPNVDYVVKAGTVQIVDPLTGRIHSERNWRDGLHQAVESRAGVALTPERSSNARVTRQRYFQRYERLAGMTGTTAGVEQELHDFFGLSTVTIPPHRPCRRRQLASRFFATGADRDDAIVREIEAERATGRPVLVGTRTIHHSRRLSERLQCAAISHAVLNGVQDQSEAEIVGRAGRRGTVTIATNMAGRGTDIRLDAAALQSGGLHVIAAEHHASRRVDRQLAGRAGRQGDPGTCRVFVSAEDELISQHAPRAAERLRTSAGPDGECRLDLSADVAAVQSRLEREAHQSRREMVARDTWLDGVLEVLAATS
jgi:preprotein translocase subunit SecA